MELVITANGPGEIGGWLLPVVDAVKRLRPTSDVTVVVTPCQYASGRESVVTSALSAVDRVCTLRGFVGHLARHLRARRPGRSRKVLHLGGDRLYAVLIARLLGAPLWAYGTSAGWRRHIDRFLAPDERTVAKLVSRRVPRSRITAVGQIVTDSVPADAGASKARMQAVCGRAEATTVTFLPGSRPVEAGFMLPFFADVADQLLVDAPGIRCLVALAPFVDASTIERVLAEQRLTWQPQEDAIVVRLRRGGSLYLLRALAIDAMASADLAVTIPGTNTLQLAALGVPMLVVVPLNRVELVPIDGLLGLLNPHWWPVNAIKRRVLYARERATRHLAIPNIVADDSIVPELRGVLEPQGVTARIEALLADDHLRRSMAERLRVVAGPRGAAARAAAALLEEDGAAHLPAQ